MSKQVEEIYSEIRKSEQAILFSYMEAINEDVGQKRRTFENFVQIETEDPIDVISRISRNPGGQFLLKLPTEVLSLLVPTARFFIIKNIGTSDSPNVRAVEMTFDDRIEPSSIESIISSRVTNTGGIGMKSFTWDMIGTDYSQQKNNIRANLTLYMQSIHEFDKTRVSSIMSGDGSVQRVEWRHSELVTHSVKSNIENPLSNLHNRIYAIVGWALPPSITDEFLRDSVVRAGLDYTVFSTEAIRDAIANSVLGMDLFLVGHNISYRQNGTITIDLDYHAAIQGILTDPRCDIFMLDRENAETIKEAEKYYQSRIKNYDQRAQKIKCDDLNSETLERKKKILEKDRERLEKHHSKNINDRRAELHSALVGEMLGNGLVNFINIKRQTEFDELLKQKQAQESGFDPKQALEVVQKLGIKESYLYEGIELELEDRVGDLAKFQNAAQDSVKNAGKTNEEIKQTLGDKNLLGEDPEKQQFSFPFIYLGDILNTAYQVLYDRDLKITNGHQFRALLGPLIYYKKMSNGRIVRKSINLADIPISFNLFTQYLIDEVVAKDRFKFPLIQFVSSLIERFIQPILSTTYATGLDFSSRARMRSTIVSGRISEKDIVTGKKVPSNTWGVRYGGARIKSEDIQVATGIDPIRGLLRSEVPYSYFYIYATSGEYEYLVREEQNGEYHDDRRGIYTLRMGVDRGLLKGINFKRTDAKYQREARIQRAYQNDNEFPDIFSYFTEKYDADAELFGAPFFLPGYHVYVDPVTLGTVPREQVRNTARKLGLGGYYMVNNVKGEISDSGFDTSLSLIWVSDGTSERKENIHVITPDLEDCRR